MLKLTGDTHYSRLVVDIRFDDLSCRLDAVRLNHHHRPDQLHGRVRGRDRLRREQTATELCITDPARGQYEHA